MMAATLSPYVELRDFGAAVRFGFSRPGALSATLTAAFFPHELPARDAIVELRDLVKRLEWRFCPELIERPPAAPVSAMSAEYGT